MCKQNKLKQIEKKQKEAIRVICNAGYREHTAPLFARLKILPIDQLIELSVMKFMHSFYHNLLPFSFNEMWLTNRNRQPERELRNADQLYIPPHRFATLKRLPLFNFPTVWNAAGNDKNNPRQYVYLKLLKSRLLSNLR
jgi:hypothetical protein